MHRRPTRSRQVAAALLIALVLVAGAFLMPAAGAPVADNTVTSVADECRHALGYEARSAGDVAWLRQCVHALTPPTAAPTTAPATPTGGATPTPTASVLPTATTLAPSQPPTSFPPATTAPSTVAPTTPPATTPPVSACPAWPATPDAGCTGYKHTGVTLKACPNKITAPGTYDSCRFAGGLVIAAAGVVVKRSLVDGGHVEGGSGSTYDLKGAVLEDVQILGPGNDGMAAIGNANYTCRRCDISNNNRGFALGNNVVVVDSYAHDFWIQPSSQRNDNSAHQTAISTHGGSGVQVRHSTLACKSDAYACSSGFSFYSEDAPGISDVLVQNCLITTDAGYGMLFGTLITGKPYGITNTRIVDNVLSSQEYGPVANWPSTQAGNVWSGNRSPSGAVISGA